jgi:hypothetical protein
MIKSSYFFIVLILVQCLATKRTIAQDDSLSDVKRYVVLCKKLSYNINNKDFNSIGYQAWEEDESIGVKSLCLYGNYIYITDVYHSSVKRIDINTGEMKTSESVRKDNPQEPNTAWFRDIGIFNGNVYVVTDRNTIYSFDLNLKALQSFSYPEPGLSAKYIFSISKDSLCTWEDKNELKDHSRQFKLFCINKANYGKEMNYVIPETKYFSYLDNRYLKGRRYKIFKKDGKSFFQSKYGIVQLDIPTIDKYDAYNIDFNESGVYFFDSKPTKFTLYIYKYKD